MTLEEAQAMVETALEQRRKFGKMFTVEDMPPEFLDALVKHMDATSPKELALQHDILELKQKLFEEHSALVLANRQLGAAAARETKLRKQLAELTKATEI